MFLSRLTLNPLDADARRDMGNPYDLHRAVMRGFATPLPDGERVLFRLEPALNAGAAVNVVLVQSLGEPDWEGLARRRRYLLTDPEVRAVPPLDLPVGMVLRFRLRANPVRRDAASGQRVALLEDEERLDWLTRKGAQAGFAPVPGMVNVRSYGTGRFAIEPRMVEKSFKATVRMADFDGLLQVTDPAALTAALAEGIGTAKGFGCGLLSLARAA